MSPDAKTEASPDDLSEGMQTAWARLIRVSQVLVEGVEADLKAAGFPPLSWYDVLLELRRHVPDGLRPFQLQEHMLLTQYNLSRLLDRMERAGLVVRRPCEEDGRGTVVTATAEGLALRERMWPAYRAAIRARFADRLTERQADDLARLMARLG
jgi:DNA-binding MarR family transcriptional regulator